MKITPQIVRDTVGVVGIGLLSYGIGLAWYPGGFIAAGTCLFGMVVVGTLRVPK